MLSVPPLVIVPQHSSLPLYISTTIFTTSASILRSDGKTRNFPSPTTRQKVRSEAFKEKKRKEKNEEKGKGERKRGKGKGERGKVKGKGKGKIHNSSYCLGAVD